MADVPFAVFESASQNWSVDQGTLASRTHLSLVSILTQTGPCRNQLDFIALQLASDQSESHEGSYRCGAKGSG